MKRREAPIHLSAIFQEDLCGPSFSAREEEEGRGSRDLSRSLLYLSLASPRGKTSGTEFKFHKLVRPLHPRRNRGRLISFSPSLSRGDLNVFPFPADATRRTVPGKRGCPLCSASQPASRTGSRSGRSQIITRVHRRSRREILETIPLVSAADPSWISRSDDGNAAALSWGCTPRRDAPHIPRNLILKNPESRRARKKSLI